MTCCGISSERGEVDQATHFHAMPLHRARVLRATRSPRSKHRAGPLTVATLILGASFDGETAEPSFRCQVTLRRARREVSYRR